MGLVVFSGWTEAEVIAFGIRSEGDGATTGCGGMDDLSLSAVARAEHHLRRHHHRHCDVGGASSVERQSMESHWNLKFEWPLF